MTREEIVSVRVKGGGAARFAAGAKYGLKLEAGQSADKWADGSPITRAEFEAVLLPMEIFEVAEKDSTAANAKDAEGNPPRSLRPVR